MAVGPLLLLIVLNCFVMVSVIRKGASGEYAILYLEDDCVRLSIVPISRGLRHIESHTRCLPLHLLQFHRTAGQLPRAGSLRTGSSRIATFTNALTVRFKLKHVIVYLVDLSNLLVVINCTANFFVYLSFGSSFRRTLCSIFSSSGGSKPSGNVSLLTNEAESPQRNHTSTTQGRTHFR